MADDVVPLFFAEVCALLRISTRTGKRLRRAGTFPIPELPKLDKRSRYSSRDVDAFNARETTFRQLGRRTA